MEEIHHEFRVQGPNSDVMEQSTIESSLDVGEDEIQETLEFLDASGCLNYDTFGGNQGFIQILPRGIDRIDDDNTIASSETLEEVFEEIYEASKGIGQPTYTRLRNMVEDERELKKALWYLGHKNYINLDADFKEPRITPLGVDAFEEQYVSQIVEHE